MHKDNPQGLWETDEFQTNLGDSLNRQQKTGLPRKLKACCPLVCPQEDAGGHVWGVVSLL